MPKIVLKPNSAEYAETESNGSVQKCEMPGCVAAAEHKAPKHRGLNEYYHFCLQHVREYNKAWNFFHGMSEKEVQAHMEKARYGERPTWQYSGEASEEDILRKSAEQEYHFRDPPPHRKNSNDRFIAQHSGPATEALALMGLDPPVAVGDIKKR